jgi:hypothetical protein
MDDISNNFRIEIYKLNVNLSCADPKAAGKSEKHIEELSRQMPLGKVALHYDLTHSHFNNLSILVLS